MKNCFILVFFLQDKSRKPFTSKLQDLQLKVFANKQILKNYTESFKVLKPTRGRRYLLKITKFILNGVIKYYLVLLFIQLGMTMNEYNVLKNNCKH